MIKLINKKVIIYLVIFFTLIYINLIFHSKIHASNKTSGIDNFPDTYKPYLIELSKKYPSWNFVALYTNLDWNYVIEKESEFGKNLVPKNYSDSWKNTTPGQYDIEIDSGWVDSSKNAVEYLMDPRNFLNEERILQFETLSYDASTNNINSIEKILYGTEFYQRKVSYLDSNGNTVNMNETYADLILRGGQTSLVSPYHLASRIKQEVGPFLSHSSISGTVEGYKGVYNFYNIGATSSQEPMGAIKNGLRYAKDGNGANQIIKDKYLIPWNTKERAITGGGIFIGSSYINVGQNTIYLQKFDVNDQRGTDLFWHQYMTNVLAPYSESKSMYNGYKKTGILDTPLSFVIPVYNNMPDIQADNPNIIKENFADDNTKVYCNGDRVNIRTGPDTSYEVLTSLNKQDKMTRIQKGINSGERWDKVRLENGMIGYIFQSYVTEMQSIEIEMKPVTGIRIDQKDVFMEINDEFKINAFVEPQDANNKKIRYESSDTDIASIDENGIITANREGTVGIFAISDENSEIKEKCMLTVVRKMEESEIDFDTSITVNSLELIGIGYNENTVADIIKKITTNLDVEIVNAKNKVLKDTDIVGTGCKIRIKENNNILREYKILIYGDVDGDGKINTVDLLVLQRHILEIELLDGIYIKAGNIDKNGNKPTSVDLLLIQRHILRMQIIKQ